MAKANSPKGRRLRERALARRHAAIADIPSTCDVCVIGAGAAGLMAALEAARAGAEVVLLEGSERLGKPILATGNGRCNLSNTVLDPELYGSMGTGDAASFVRVAMGDSPEEAIEGVFSSLGLAMVEESGRIYPRSMRAESVRDVVVDALPRSVVAGTLRRVTAVERVSEEACAAVVAAPDFRVTYEELFRERGDGWATGAVYARSVVLACGGGVTDLARDLGLPITDLQRVLCPVAVEPAPAAPMVGRRARVVASVVRDGEPVFRESGEMLFREKGLSGIVSFDLSRQVVPGDLVVVDLVPWIDLEGLADRLEKAFGTNPGHPERVLAGLMDPAIGAVLVEMAQAQGGPLPLETARLAKGLTFAVTGLADHDLGQVVRGGVDLSAVNPRSMASTAIPGLHLCGELMDVDGPCGGYNLAFAWLTGRRAGSSAAAWSALGA